VKLRKAIDVVFGSNVARRISSNPIEVNSTGRTLGAEVRNVDVRSFDDWQFAAFMRALLRHQALLVRGQLLSDPDLIAFCRRFGGVGCTLQDRDLDSAGELREIHVDSNANRDIGTSATPLAMARIPSPLASVLYAPGAASSGARITFCSQYAVYDALPSALRSRIAHLKIGEDDRVSDGCFAWRRAQANQPRTSSGVVRPLVSTHPDTGRAMLYLGRKPNARLLGLQKEESDDLLDELRQFAERSEFSWEHELRPGDLLMWDNRCTVHQRQQFDPPRVCSPLENRAAILT
jgi:taurine dioxygenase